jgi:uncharacterized membrane protein
LYAVKRERPLTHSSHQLRRGSTMSSLVVITFDNPDEAHELRLQLKELQKEGQINVEDSAVIRKDENGKIHVVNEVDKTVMGGAAVGGLLGMLLFILFPVAGIALGAAGGALIGSTLDRGVDKKFVKQVSEELKPNSSALFMVTNEANVTAAVAALRQHTGKLYQTNLSPEAEDELRRALHEDVPLRNPAVS